MAKLTHGEAGYREYGTPQAHCSNCTMYRPTSAEKCTLVENPIEFWGWCRFHDPIKK